MRQIRCRTVAFVALLASDAAAVAQVYRHDLAYDSVRYPDVQLAADLPQGACQYYANPPANQLCVDTTEDLCKTYYLSVWRKGYTCAELETGACEYYLSDNVTEQCLVTTRSDCKRYNMSHWYPDETCSD